MAQFFVLIVRTNSSICVQLAYGFSVLLGWQQQLERPDLDPVGTNGQISVRFQARTTRRAGGLQLRQGTSFQDAEIS
jgi:hypothetical protein